MPRSTVPGDRTATWPQAGSMGRHLARLAVLCVVALVGALVSPMASQATTAPTELRYACALKSNGNLRAVATASDCGKNETLVTFKPGPVRVCVQPSGSSRYVTSFSKCRPPALQLTLPPTSGVVYFCADASSGVLRYVTDPVLCTSSEVPYQVTPNDAAPRVISTSPADGATHVSTTTNVTITFSEPVTVVPDSVTMTCDGVAQPVSEAGSPGTTLTLDPQGDLTPGALCSVTVPASGVSDVDTNDPPDNPAADYTFSFTVDAAPTLLSSTPADGATDVQASASITLTFSEPVDVAAGAFTLTCGGSSRAVTVTGSGTDTVTVHPAAALPLTTTCSLTAPASSITDVDTGDPPDQLTAPISIGFTTLDLAPTVVSTSPTDNAANVATNTSITVTFSEPVDTTATPVALSCGGDPKTYTATGSGTTTLTIAPDASLPTGSVCTVTVTAAAISDVDGVDPPDHLASDYTFSFTTDAPPAVVSTSPADGASGVDPGSNVVVTFTEPVTVTSSSFVLTCGGSPVGYALSGSGSDTVTLNPTADLPGTSSCTVKVVGSQVSDVDTGDPPDTMTSDVSATFTTVDTAPAVASTSPADGATDASSGANIVITFTESVTTTDAAFAVACPTGTPVAFTLSGSPGSTITLDPTDPLPPGATCTVSITATGVHDTDPIDPPDTMASDVSFSFTVSPNAAPTDLALSNAAVAENQPVGTTVGTLSTTDPDAGDTFTYSLVSGAGDTDNGSFSISGDTLATAASFDFETKNSYSVRIQTKDSAGNTFAKSFTITVTDVNEAPTGLALSNAAVDENKPSGTAVGTLSTTDPDAGDTFTYSLVSGAGGTDNASFQISGDTLQTAASFDFETKAVYSVRIQTKDSGGLTYETSFTITVNNVNDPPVAATDTYTGAVGNTLAVLGTTGTGPKVTLSGNLLLANDTDQDGDPLTVTAGTTTSTRGGTATINADGSFTFLPAVGDKSVTDTFTYTVSDGQASATGTVSVAIGSDLVWYVDSAYGGAQSDGRSGRPLTSLSTLDGAGGSGDVDSAGDVIFVYPGSGSYAGGLPLEGNQRLWGQPNGLVLGGSTIVAAGGTNPVITNASGNGIDLATGADVQGVDVTGASGDGIHAEAIGAATVGTTTPVTVSTSGADGVDINGQSGGAATITIGATVTGSAGRSVNVSGRTGGTVSFTGPVTGPAVALSSNSGAAVAFSGKLAISTTSAGAFTATGGGTVSATSTTSTLSSTTGTALTVDGVTIGTGGLTFKSVSANGAVNGIRLNNTGTTAGLTVLGGGSAAQGGDASGGTIQNTTGAGVSLTSTKNVSLTNLTVTGTPNAPGIDGTGVSGFSFVSGTISGNGTASHNALHSGIAFNDDGPTIANVTDAFTVSKSNLVGAYGGGIHVVNRSGILTSVTVTNNTVQSPAASADSAGSGILFDLSGSSTTTAAIGSGSISGNSVTGYPNGGGIILLGGNPASSSGPVANFGSSGSHLAINGNLVAGASAANPMSTQCIEVALTGRGTSYVDVTSNGTAGSPLGLNRGTCVSIDVTGAHVLNSAITGNYVKPQTQISGSFGIAGGTDKRVLSDLTTLDSAVLNATISNNTVSSTDSSGIRFLANSTGTLNARVQNNNVAAPSTTASAAGIRVDSGTSSGTAADTNVCLQISSNTTAGSTGVGTVTPGIGLRKQGTVSTTNDFGVVGLPNNPSTAAQTESYVSGQNPLSASGTFGTGGAAVISGSNFIPCTLAF
ncbi:beta strand repeat-containing protein [Intrasporangium oryzae]|nr:Ig-like domain-containing protein [Intrasporangium oryzae]